MRVWGRGAMLTTAVALCVTFSPRPAFAQDSGIDIGSQAPAAALETLDGMPADLSQYIGKGPTLLEFWATWCPNCRALEPQMQAATAKYAGKVKFIAIAVAVNETRDRVKAYRDAHALKQEVLFDTKGKAAANYDAPATSYIVVLDATGKVVYTGVGSEQNIEQAIRKAL
jgi:thiol-disulfide isomerase/thioredoxin